MHLVWRLRGCCPENCLQLVSLDRIQFEPETVQQIRDHQELFGVEFDEVTADELGIVTGSAMLKDETRCIRCGLCAARCPVGHHHDGVVQPGFRRANRIDFD